MKKMLICCGVLCMTFLLFCGSALAAEPTITVTNNAVTVEKGATDGTYTVTRSSGVSDGQLYLVLILEGSDTTPKPTTENVYYMDVASASGTSVSFTAYPKALNEAKTYTVFLSDYSQSGAAKAVATIAFAGGGTGSIVYGDINGDKQVDATDRAMLARYVAQLPGWFGESAAAAGRVIHTENADLNIDGQIDATDRAILARYVAQLPGWTTIPRTPST